MQTKTYTTADRSNWGPGPWDGEPDKAQWQDQATSLPCLAVRSPTGNWCGYVGVPESHPLYQVHYADFDMSVHGGLTFSEHCRFGREEDAICHIPAPGEPDNVWWFGFDCAHHMDLSPDPRLPRIGTYRTLDYVQKECEGLAEKLSNWRE